MKIVTAVLLLLPLLGKTQMDSMRLQWDQVSEIKGSKSILFQKSKAWIYSYYTNVANLVQLMDSSAGTIIVSSIDLGGNYIGYPIHGSLRVDVKSNKVRFQLYDFYGSGTNYASYKNEWGATMLDYNSGKGYTFWIKNGVLSDKRTRKKWMSDKNPISNTCKKYNDDYLMYVKKDSDNW